jgi:hypothetical protein
MTTEFRHPIFARLVAFVAARAEGSEDDDLRRELLSGLCGRVVDVGAGSGRTSGSVPAVTAGFGGYRSVGVLQGEWSTSPLSVPGP